MSTAMPTAAGRASTGDAFASFLLGAVDNGARNVLAVVPGNRYRSLAAYIQDDWKATRRLTLNLGFRYDLFLPRSEAHSNLSGFDPSLPNPSAGNRPHPLGGSAACCCYPAAAGRRGGDGYLSPLPRLTGFYDRGSAASHGASSDPRSGSGWTLWAKCSIYPVRFVASAVTSPRMTHDRGVALTGPARAAWAGAATGACVPGGYAFRVPG